MPLCSLWGRGAGEREKDPSTLSKLSPKTGPLQKSAQRCSQLSREPSDSSPHSPTENQGCNRKIALRGGGGGARSPLSRGTAAVGLSPHPRTECVSAGSDSEVMWERTCG